MALLEPEVRRGAGPVLRDGTAIDDLIDREHYEVSLRVLSDPELYQYELEHLFGKMWNLVGHESEIPESGDYVMRYVGEDPIIVTRDAKGEIHGLLNVCTHRGMMVCRAEGGKGTQFKCPYHGWTFSNTGRFLGSPIAKEQMHGDVRSKEELGLKKARVDTYAGMIFATFNEEGPSLKEWLGEISWYLDLMFDRTPEGLEVLGPPQRFMINANWKCPGEQHAGDGFHTLTLHHSLAELQAMAGDEDNPTAQLGLNVSANGHGLRCIDIREPSIVALKDKVQKDMDPMERMMIAPPPGLTPAQVPNLKDRFSDAEIRVLAEYPPQAGGLFPNIGTFAFPFPTAEGMSAVIALHVFVPRGPDKFEFFNWYLTEKSAPQELKDSMRRASTLAFGISGFIETDDADTWPQMTAASRGTMGRQQTIKYGALCGEDQPLTGYWDEEGPFPGGGHLYPGFTKDDAQWQWWLRWRDFMTADPWSDNARR
jgi:phenylpropionate dioxygenase-like ring-hydroxylating dioxygenase large terminal subunit